MARLESDYPPILPVRRPGEGHEFHGNIGFGGLEEMVSSFSFSGSVAAASASLSDLNCASRSANCCCSAATFSSACPTSFDSFITRPRSRIAVVARPMFVALIVFRPRNAPRMEAPTEIAACIWLERDFGLLPFDHLSARLMRSCKRAIFGAYFWRSASDCFIPCFPSGLLQPHSEIPLGLPWFRHLFRAGALQQLDFLRPEEPPGKSLFQAS